jgi:hypothetical protein
MFNINFDLFYELKQGSVVSISYKNDKLGVDSTSFYRVKNSTLEIKYVDHVHDKIYDWHKIDSLAFHPDSVFKIEERFERFANG